jgi:hypothetical protein
MNAWKQNLQLWRVTCSLCRWNTFIYPNVALGSLSVEHYQGQQWEVPGHFPLNPPPIRNIISVHLPAHRLPLLPGSHSQFCPHEWVHLEGHLNTHSQELCFLSLASQGFKLLVSTALREFPAKRSETKLAVISPSALALSYSHNRGQGGKNMSD